METPNFRIGFGYDIHRFADGRKFILGGVEIPYSMGLDGHSDADVLLHSLCDAILGAAGFEDIGHQFPNTDPEFKDISSLVLLEESMKLADSAGWKIANTDIMVILEDPKIYPHIPEMKKNISGIINCDTISIKATTNEGLGGVGRGEGCACYSVVLLYK
ncbi:MAG: 2-C-methyl-D-erythritol 2,4-cyclodiphosphate synthase [Ignavibacteriae bacterium]|nr:2-C-methyl-D-erythritol 2,4-cyclodiphosphate synthase [Ignavibacteriota bacterium]MCB9243701.1 2-C-methyl-D-erythritol 2,4-cyclodiphosphate synthase [Ignavibacteriales bacterium]